MMLNKRFKVIVIVIFFVGLFGFNYSFSSEQRINSVLLNGTNKISSSEFIRILNLKNKVFTKKTKKEIENFLNSLSFIENFMINYKNNLLTVNIKEKAIVKNINISGNKKISEADLKNNIISIKKNSFFSEDFLRKDIEEIKKAYTLVGFLSAIIDYKIVQVDKNFVNVSITINEGKKTKIKSIEFIGNDKISKSKLLDIIYNKKDNFFRFGNKITYNETNNYLNSKSLYDFYFSKGFLDFRLVSIDKDFSNDKENVALTFVLEEGLQYKINDLKIINRVRSFNQEDIFDKIIKENLNSIFNYDRIKDGIEEIENILSKKGYNFVNVDSEIFQNNDLKLVDIKILITETDKKYAGRINIINNTRTYSKIIRQQIPFSEGDALDSALLNKTKRRIMGTGFFKDVKIIREPNGSADNIRDLNIFVEEGNTGSIQLSFGYSSLDGLNFGFDINQNNLFGLGYSANFASVFSNYRRNLNVGFGKPNVFDTNMFGGFNIFYAKYLNTKYSSNKSSIGYDEENAGFTLYTTYDLSEYLTQKLYYEYNFKRNFNINTDYNDVLQKKDQYISEFGTGLYFDKRDNKIYPLNGFYSSLNLGLAGLGGNKDYFKTELDMSYFYQIYKKLVFKVQGNGGYIKSFGGNPLYPDDGFYIGGNRLRGFSYGSAGPRIRSLGGVLDKDSNSLGGTEYYVFNTELRFPLTNKQSLNLFGILFFNMGLTTGIEDNDNISKNRIVDVNKIRSSYGVSFVFKTPMGDIAFEFSKPIKKEDFDQVERFRVNIGRSF